MKPGVRDGNMTSLVMLSGL